MVDNWQPTLFGCKDFKVIEIPASWFLLNMLFISQKKGQEKTRFMSFDDCAELVKKMKLKINLKAALWFLHHGMGVLLYYEHVQELNDIVIFDKQVVFDSATKLIINSYKQTTDETQYNTCAF